MTTKQDVLSQLDALIAEGNKLEGSYQCTVDSMGAYYSDLPETDFRAFATKAIAAIERAAGANSQFYRSLPTLPQDAISNPGYCPTFIASVIGCLVALRDAVDNGHLESLEARIRAHVHDDFLQQGKDLLDSGYHVAAMVLIGGVLEDHLNKLCIACAGSIRGSIGASRSIVETSRINLFWIVIESVSLDDGRMETLCLLHRVFPSNHPNPSDLRRMVRMETNHPMTIQTIQPSVEDGTTSRRFPPRLPAQVSPARRRAAPRPDT